MIINPRGFWENKTREGHAHDEGLARALLEFFLKEKNDLSEYYIWDIGCGDGYYTNYLNNESNKSLVCWGLDGNPNTPKMGGLMTCVADFSEPLGLHANDWVLCLEVGEHIPQQFETIFLENLDRMNIEGIVLSWAIRGQGGDGHVNCLDNYEVISRIQDFGYKWDVESSMKLRLSCATFPKPCYWFRDTIMVFRRNKYAV